MHIPFFSSFNKLRTFFSSGSALVLWYRHYKVVIFIGFLVVLAYGGWNYYFSLYQFRFSDQEKQQYVDSYFKETIFKEKRFHDVVDSLAARARAHTTVLSLSRNIFEQK